MPGVQELRDRFWELLRAAFGNQVVINGHPARRLPNMLNVSFVGCVGAEILARMPDVAASTGSACHAGQITLSPVLKAMGIAPEVGMGAIRFKPWAQHDAGGDRRGREHTDTEFRWFQLSASMFPSPVSRFAPPKECVKASSPFSGISLRLRTSSFQNRNGLHDHGTFILRNSSENSSELFLAHLGKLTGCAATLSR
jgi:hypothetical protein